jgi:ketosteroid isomerase-like protein
MLETEIVEAEVTAVAEQESRAMSTGNVELYLSLLTDDCIFFPPNAAAKTGEELRTWLRDFLEHYTVEWIGFHHGTTLVDGNLASHDYWYAMKTTPIEGGDPIVACGKGMQVMRYGRRGNWKIVRNIWNASPQERTGGR